MTPTSSPDPASDPTQPALLRHIVPVLVGGVVALLLTLVTDNTLSAHGALPASADVLPGTGALLLVALYRAVFAILGCHIAARLAPAGQPRMRYALALGGVMLVVNVLGAGSNWGKVPSWYLLSSIALTIPYAIVGGGTAVRAIAEGQARANR